MSKLISALAGLLALASCIFLFTIALAADKGVYDGSEEEFISILSNMTAERCPSATSKGDPWLDGNLSNPDLAIFPRHIEKMLFDYHFLEGKYIPRKYSRLVDEKISGDCGCKWSSKIF